MSSHSNGAGESFNSKLVRLKDKIRLDISSANMRFNSKLVRLKANSASNGIPSWKRFNSKLVRLKEKAPVAMLTTRNWVSIPNWCD